MGLFVDVLLTVLEVYKLVLLARVLITWLPSVDRSNPIIQFLYDITEPVLRPIREMLPQTGMIDFSPIIVFLVLQVLTVIIPATFR